MHSQQLRVIFSRQFSSVQDTKNIWGQERRLYPSHRPPLLRPVRLALSLSLYQMVDNLRLSQHVVEDPRIEEYSFSIPFMSLPEPPLWGVGNLFYFFLTIYFISVSSLLPFFFFF